MRNPFPESVQKQMAQQYAAGETADNIAERYCTTRKLVSGAVRRHGGEMRRRGYESRAFTQDERRGAVHLWNKGATLLHVAAWLDTSEPTASRILREEGCDTKRTREGCPNRTWKPSRRKAASGYVSVKVHPNDPMFVMCNDRDYVLEHRYVMAQTLGRPLADHETVHHRNGDRTDNRPENLELWKTRHVKGVRATDYHCHGCLCGCEEPLLLSFAV